jgi:HEAT repeat protein
VTAAERRDLLLQHLTAVVEKQEHPFHDVAAELLRRSEAAALPYLTRLIRSPHDRARRQAIYILRYVKADPTQMLPLFRQWLEDRSVEVRKAAYQALHERKEGALAVALLRERLACLRAEERVEALRALAEAGPSARDALPFLLPELQHRSSAVREAALTAVLKVASGAVEAQPALAALLGDEVVEIQHLALGGLIAIGPPAIPALLAALDHPDDNVRYGALAGLAELPRLPAEALPLLLRKLKNAVQTRRCGVPAAHFQARAALALGKLGEAGAPAVPDLTAALRHPDADVRASAARALGAIGQSARSAEAELKALRRDRHEPVRRAAAEALAKLVSEAR